MSANANKSLSDVITESLEFYFQNKEYNPEFLSFLYLHFGPKQFLEMATEMMCAHRMYLENNRNGLDAEILKVKAAENEATEVQKQHVEYLEG